MCGCARACVCVCLFAQDMNLKMVFSDLKIFFYFSEKDSTGEYYVLAEVRSLYRKCTNYVHYSRDDSYVDEAWEHQGDMDKVIFQLQRKALMISHRQGGSLSRYTGNSLSASVNQSVKKIGTKSRKAPVNIKFFFQLQRKALIDQP